MGHPSRVGWTAWVVALALLGAPVRAADTVLLRIMQVPLAGFQYHAGKILWDEMREGDVLTLAREPDNRHDPRAVRVEWRGVKLGYLPRGDNAQVAAAMDRGEGFSARIGRLASHPDPWKRVRVDVFLAL
ncbi:MAG: HIRAN domain-containing protein [Rhodocyclaceae bacterium]|nr:HIRAN domain-containing protein [Rhodocyclaceae bacterium]